MDEVNVNVKLRDEFQVACLDAISVRDGNSGRNAVLRKALARLIECDLTEKNREEIRRELAKKKAA